MNVEQGVLLRSFAFAVALFASACAGERTQSVGAEPSPATSLEVRAPTPELAKSELVVHTEALELEPELEPEPEPEPEPTPFAGRRHVSVDELLAQLDAELPAIAASEAVRADFAHFVEELGIGERVGDEALYLDYVRVKLAFEATRAGGLWGLSWDITNEQPNSEKIWAAWRELDAPPVPDRVDELEALPTVTAIAECDELSALFAFVTQRIGLSRSSQVGLFWPTGNHVVAVWTIDAKSDAPVRVVVPTSQIFLGPEDSLGTRGFDPYTQKNIFDYRRQDAAGKLELPALLAAHFVLSVRAHAGRSQSELQAQRNARELL